jgi:septal ring factor EnvC (AmiA/AmiB activator)
MFKQRSYLLFCLVFILKLSFAENTSVMSAKTNLKQLETKISQLQHTLNRAQDKQSVIHHELQLNEKQMAAGQRQLQLVQQDLNNNEARIKTLQLHIDKINDQLHSQQQLLAQHMRVQYKMGEYQPIKWLLNQDNPYEIDRLLTLHQYIVKSRKLVLDGVMDTQKKLLSNQNELKQTLHAQQQLQQQLTKHQQQLDRNKLYHTALLRSLQQDIQNKQQMLASYRRNQANLSRLLDTLVQQSVLQTRYPFTQLQHKLMNPVQTTRSSIQKLNHGAIFYANEGAAVQAVYPGKVVFCDWLNGYCYLMIIDHGWGFMTLYANNQSLFKRKGDSVVQGEQIASVGHSGTLKQNGLYFEIRRRGKAISPLDWMSS